jgi:hypothetical protein
MSELRFSKAAIRPDSTRGSGKADASGSATPKIVKFPVQPATWRYSVTGTAVRIFLTTWLVFTLHFATNTVREIYPAMSLGDHLSFDVSEYSGLHPDIFTLEGRGTFINNNPGASMIGAIPYLISKPAIDLVVDRVQRSRAGQQAVDPPKYDTIYPMAQEFYKAARDRGYDVKFGLAAGTTQAFASAPISALGAVVMFLALLGLTKNIRVSAILSLLYAFSTPILFRTAQLNQNVLLANFALFAFVLIMRPAAAANKKRPFYLLSGLLCGWTVVLDYSGVVFVLALSIYVFLKWKDTEKNNRKVSGLVRFAAGVAVSISVLLAYQWICFGNPLLPAQSYMPPANFTDLGYRGFSFPRADLLFETAFGMRYGLFTSAPILLLVFAVPFWLRRSSRLMEYRETFFVVLFTVMFFIFCSANQYGRMQFNTGVRHILPVVPFLFILAANVLLRLPKLFAVPFAIVATYWSWCLAMYRDVEQGSGILEAVKHITLEGFQLPWLTTLERMGIVGHASVIPLFLLCSILFWLIWSLGARRPIHDFGRTAN